MFAERLKSSLLIRALCFLPLLAAVIGVMFLYGARDRVAIRPQVEAERTLTQEELATRIHSLCTHCHSFPTFEAFPKSMWRDALSEDYSFARQAGVPEKEIPPFEQVLAYFQERAPAGYDLALVEASSALEDLKVPFREQFYNLDGNPSQPGISFVRWVRLRSTEGLDCLVSDMRNGLLMLWEHDRAEQGLQVLAEVPYPAHATVVDLDQDGHQDIVVADLGNFFPVNDRWGRAVWLRYGPDRDEYRPYVLLQDVGRVADVEPADFDGDGDLDLVVAVFGWRENGAVVYLENRTRDWSQPVFHPITLDDRTGAIHVPVADLNGDGRPDFVALLSQEHEQIVAFLNEGSGRFRQEVIYAAPDPSYGSTGIQLVDLDQDGDLDVLYTNGDVLDWALMRPFHSIQWLENKGGFPFEHHHLAHMGAVHRAVAGDLDGDGDLDVVACSFVPSRQSATPESLRLLPSMIWLEQVAPRKFVVQVLETGRSYHPTLDLADFDADGDADIVVGHFTYEGLLGLDRDGDLPGGISIWENKIHSAAQATGDGALPTTPSRQTDEPSSSAGDSQSRGE